MRKSKPLQGMLKRLELNIFLSDLYPYNDSFNHDYYFIFLLIDALGRTMNVPIIFSAAV